MLITFIVIFILGSIILAMIIGPVIRKLSRKGIPDGRVQADYKPVFDITRNDMYVRNKCLRDRRGEYPAHLNEGENCLEKGDE